MLQVADNGIGIREDFDYHRATSLGMQLLHTLARQLGGTVRISGPGTIVTLIFH